MCRARSCLSMRRVFREARAVKRWNCPPRGHAASALHGARETFTRRELSRSTPKPEKTLQWRLECLAHSALEAIVSVLPGPLVFRFGELLGGLAWHLLPQRRKIVLRNLRIAFAGEKELPEIRRMARETFRRSGANLVSVAHTARLAPEQVRKVVKVENMHLLEEAQARGKGVVLLLAHMGNWELLTKLIHVFPPGSKCGAFYRPLNNPLLDARVLAHRQADGTRMFSKRDPFHEVTKFLREGGIVGILSDQRVGMQGEVVPFFGRLTRTSPLPSLLARRAKGEVLALSLVTESPGKWKAAFLSVDSPPTTRHCMMALESAMRLSPIDVFWLQERWKAYISPYWSFQQWLGATDLQSKKKHRALIWKDSASTDWQFPENWQHPDVHYVNLPPACRAENAKPLGIDDIESLLQAIDERELTPLDFIVTPAPCPALQTAANRLAIPLIQLS